MNELLKMRYEVSVLPTPTGTAGGPVDFNATGDKYLVQKPFPFDIYRYGFITIDAMDPDAGGFVLDLDKRPTVGSDTSRSNLATITRADADTVAAGTVIYKDMVAAVAVATGVDGSSVYVGPDGPLRINPGEEAVIEVSNAVGAASTGYVWIQYAELAFDNAGQDDVTVDTA